MKQTRKTAQDETRYCEQCGISYIWTIEEQRSPVIDCHTLDKSTQDNSTQAIRDIESKSNVTKDNAIDLDRPVNQRQAQVVEGALIEPPIYCPGCRQLLPTAGRERGVVKWYNRRKGYGFIIRQSAPEIYVNRAALRRGHLRPDEFVEFEVTENQQGPAATKVTFLKSE